MNRSMKEAYGQSLLSLMGQNEKIFLIDASQEMDKSLSKIQTSYPDRFIEAGLSEQDMVGVGAGLVREGFIPVISSSSCYGILRAYEQMRNAVSLQQANVKFILTNAGLSAGEEGAMHQSIEDLAIMRVLPHFNVFIPADYFEAKAVIKKSMEINGPTYIRLARPETKVFFNEYIDFIPGKGKVIKEGRDITIVVCGIMLEVAIEVMEILEGKYISVELLNLPSIKPFDHQLVIDSVRKTQKVITVEEHSVIGGLGSIVNDTLVKENITDLKIDNIGLNDCFGRTGNYKDLLNFYGLNKESIAERSFNLF